MTRLIDILNQRVKEEYSYPTPPPPLPSPPKGKKEILPTNLTREEMAAILQPNPIPQLKGYGDGTYLLTIDNPSPNHNHTHTYGLFQSWDEGVSGPGKLLLTADQANHLWGWLRDNITEDDPTTYYILRIYNANHHKGEYTPPRESTTPKKVKVDHHGNREVTLYKIIERYGSLD